ncbi:MAG: choice-of-anchor D domain-containing protein, partial [Chloroflexota bacterium]
MFDKIQPRREIGCGHHADVHEPITPVNASRGQHHALMGGPAWFRRKRWLLILMSILCANIILTAKTAQAQTIVTGQGPEQNAVSVDTGVNITATFSTNISTTTVTTRTFTMHSPFRGYYTDIATVSGDTITLNPSQNLFVGEPVQVVATAGISDTGNQAVTPHQWGFTTGFVSNQNERLFIADASQTFQGVRFGEGIWGDVDNDGDLDILITGRTSSGTPDTSLYKNDGNGHFIIDATQTITDVDTSAAAWGDADNDGDLDLLLTGRDSIDTSIASLYTNDGNGNFAVDVATTLIMTGVQESDVAWGDIDNDGDLDFLLTGHISGGSSNAMAALYKNDGSGTFTVDATQPITGVSGNAAAWGDADNDGDLDLLLTSDGNGGDHLAAIYINDGSGQFTLDATETITGVVYGSVAWGDADNDRDLDILFTGLSVAGPMAAIYNNDGAGNFSIAATQTITAVTRSSVAWGDADNDGDLDLLLTGNRVNNGSSPDPVATLYQNDGTGHFSVDATQTLTGVGGSSATWGDADNDGDLDILIMGASTGSGISNGSPLVTLYKNQRLQEIAVLGNSLLITDGDTSPTLADHTDFGGQDITTHSITRTFTISNSGEITLTLSGTPIVGLSGATDVFMVTAQPSVTALNGDSTTTFTVQFDPIAQGTVSATVTITSNDSNESLYTFVIQGTGATQEIELTGQGNAIIHGSTTPTTTNGTDFGAAALGVPIIQTFIISNTEAATLTLTLPMTISGANASNFAVTADPVTQVAGSSATTFQVTFTPTIPGTHSATIEIGNNDSDENPYTFAVQGAGLLPEIALTGQGGAIVNGSTTPTTTNGTDFGAAALGVPVVQTFTISNTAVATLTLTLPITISGANASNFAVTANPATDVAGSSVTTFQLTFLPTISGTHSATIEIGNNDGDEHPYTFAIEGVGLLPEIAVTGQGSAIGDGSPTPSTTNGTDFGAAVV